MTRRTIFPARAFGMSGTIQTFFGRVILPISASITTDTLSSTCVPGLNPGFTET